MHDRLSKKSELCFSIKHARCFKKVPITRSNRMHPLSLNHNLLQTIKHLLKMSDLTFKKTRVMNLKLQQTKKGYDTGSITVADDNGSCNLR